MENARKMLRMRFLPHIGITDDDNIKKAYFFGYIIRRLLLSVMGKRVMDTEHYGNKRLDLAGF